MNGALFPSLHFQPWQDYQGTKKERSVGFVVVGDGVAVLDVARQIAM